MTESIDGDAGGEVKIVTILGIPEIASFAFDHHWGWPDVCSNHVRSVFTELGGRWGVSRRIGIGDRCFLLFICQHILMGLQVVLQNVQ